jgi:hypothetical protein
MSVVSFGENVGVVILSAAEMVRDVGKPGLMLRISLRRFAPLTIAKTP